MVNTNQKVASKLLELERRLKGHDGDIDDIIGAIRDMMEPRRIPRRIGFQTPKARTGIVMTSAAIRRA